MRASVRIRRSGPRCTLPSIPQCKRPMTLYRLVVTFSSPLFRRWIPSLVTHVPAKQKERSLHINHLFLFLYHFLFRTRKHTTHMPKTLSSQRRRHSKHLQPSSRQHQTTHYTKRTITICRLPHVILWPAPPAPAASQREPSPPSLSHYPSERLSSF